MSTYVERGYRKRSDGIRLNMRTAHGVYRTLQHYLEDADKDGFDEDIDMDFRSVRLCTSELEPC